MIRSKLALSLLFVGALAVSPARGEEEYFVKDGIQYKRVRQVTQRAIPETRIESHSYTAVTPRYVTDMQESVRTYQVPVTEQQWVPGYQRTLNIFAPPVLSYRLVPVTRWETRTETVRVPVTRVDYVSEQRVQQVPITSHRLAQETHEHVFAIGPSGANAPLVANSNSAIGGKKLDSNPPAGGSSSGGGDRWLSDRESRP